MAIKLIDLLADQLKQHGNQAEVTYLGDESGSCIEVKKRNDKKEYITCLEFNGEGTELTGVSIYSGRIIESIDHQKIV